MSKSITQALKLILTGFSLYLAYLQFVLGNNVLSIYWVVVAAYWFFNFLSGLPSKK